MTLYADEILSKVCLFSLPNHSTNIKKPISRVNENAPVLFSKFGIVKISLENIFKI